jgi:hypothetical protein
LLKTHGDLMPEHAIVGDSMLKKYIKVNKATAYTVLPSIIQHIGAFRSTKPTPGIIAGTPRNTFCFDPSFDVFSVDWDKEFADPFVDNTGPGLINFDGWIPGENDHLFNERGYPIKP